MSLPSFTDLRVKAKATLIELLKRKDEVRFKREYDISLPNIYCDQEFYLSISVHIYKQPATATTQEKLKFNIVAQLMYIGESDPVRFDFEVPTTSIAQAVDIISDAPSYFTICSQCKVKTCMAKQMPIQLASKAHQDSYKRDLEYQHLPLSDSQVLCSECYIDILCNQSDMMDTFECEVCSEERCNKLKFKARGECAEHMENMCIQCVENFNEECPCCQKTIIH